MTAESTEPATAPVVTVGGTRRLEALDGLRAIYVAIVFVHHLVWANGGRLWLPGAFVSVDGFLSLSGFLIGTLVLTELGSLDRLRFRRYVGRRLLRILPALLAGVAAVTVVSVFALGRPFARTWPSVRTSLTFTMDRMFGEHGIDLAAAGSKNALLEFSHLWSVSVEVQAYLALAIVLPLIWRLRRSPILVSIVCVAATIPITMHRLSVWNAKGFPAAYVFADVRIDTILWGVALAGLVRAGRLHTGHIPILRMAAGLSLLWLIMIAGWHGPDSAGAFWFLLPTSAFANTVIVAWAALDPDVRPARWLAARPITAIGRSSYPLYIVHMAAILWAARLPDGQPVAVRIVAAVALSLTGAAIIHRFVEQPFLSLRHRLRRIARHEVTGG